MANAAAASGTATLVATPHIDWRWGVCPAEIATHAATLGEMLGREGIELDLRTGGEIAISRLPDLTSEELDTLRLGSGPYLLIECPLSLTSGHFDLLLQRICADGESIVLAHPERCPLFQQEPERLVRLVEEGLLCSITAGSMRGDFGRRVRHFTIDLLREDLVHDVFLAAFRQRHRFRGDSSTWTWLAAIAINQCRSHRRRHMLRLRWLRSLHLVPDRMGRWRNGDEP